MTDSPLLFPLDALPDKIKNIVQQVYDEMNFPENYTAAALLFATSVAIGNSRVLKAKADWKVKSILFMALIGEPGALKSHPINFVLKPFEKSDTITLAQYEKELEEYIGALQPAVYDDFIGTAKSLMGDRQREMLRHLLTFKIEPHHTYNLPVRRRKMIEKQIQKRARQLLE